MAKEIVSSDRVSNPLGGSFINFDVVDVVRIENNDTKDRSIVFKRTELIFLVMLFLGFGLALYFSIWRPNDTDKSKTVSTIDWINENGINITSLDMYYESTADLQPLQSILKDVDVLFLTENTYGDGDADMLRGRIIKYLHETLNYNTLLYEIGMFDGMQAFFDLKTVTNSSSNKQIQSIYSQNFPDYWGKINETQEMFHYLVADMTSDTLDNLVDNNELLELGGFDVVGNGVFDGDLTRNLTDFLVTYLPSDQQPSATFYNILANVTNYWYITQYNLGRHDYLPSSTEMAEYSSTFDSVLNTLKSMIPTASYYDFSYWTQIYNNTYYLATASFNQWSGDDNPHMEQLEQIRQSIMAENIEWWLQDDWLTPRKIIVWSNNMNAVYNQDDIQGYTCSAYTSTCIIVSSGDIVKAKLGKKVYTMATTAFAGKCGNSDYVPIIDIASKNSSLESLVHSTNNFPIAGIIDFVNVELPEFLSNSINSSSFSNYTTYYSILPNHFDGVIIYSNQSVTNTLPASLL